MNATLKAQIKEKLSPIMDRVTISKDGKTVTCKSSYYYRHGRTAQGLSESVKKILKEMGLDFSNVEYSDSWNPWPKDSFFKVVVTLL